MSMLSSPYEFILPLLIHLINGQKVRSASTWARRVGWFHAPNAMWCVGGYWILSPVHCLIWNSLSAAMIPSALRAWAHMPPRNAFLCIHWIRLLHMKLSCYVPYKNLQNQHSWTYFWCYLKLVKSSFQFGFGLSTSNDQHFEPLVLCGQRQPRWVELQGFSWTCWQVSLIWRWEMKDNIFYEQKRSEKGKRCC